MFNAKPFPHLAKDLKTDESTEFIGNVFVSESCEIGENCIIDGSKHRIMIHPNCKIGKNTKIIAQEEKLEIGANVIIGENCLILSSIKESIIIENNETVTGNIN